jgi:hypothetical protein
MPQVADIQTKNSIENKSTKTFSNAEQKAALAKKMEFKKDFKNALSIEEARALSLKHIRSLWKK